MYGNRNSCSLCGGIDHNIEDVTRVMLRIKMMSVVRHPNEVVQEKSKIWLKRSRIDVREEESSFNNRIYTKEALEISAKLILANPEFMTAWNYRKLAFQHNIDQKNDLDYVKSIIDEELKVVDSALLNNCKSYGAWYHRKWVNFYSVLLTQLMEKKVEGYFPKENILKNEFDYVHHAILPAPDDQSVWFYHLWLLDQTVKVNMPTLVSSSPPHGSDVNQSTFPVVLYFSEPVEGISSHTVTVQTTENDIFKNITWTQLSTNNHKCGQAWMTHLSIPLEDFNSSKTIQVKISSEHIQGITSLSGVSCNRPWSFTFTVSICYDLKPVGQIVERISLTDGNFCAIDTNSNRTALIKSYFESSSNFEDPISSKWKSEMIASGIHHFRDALNWAEGKIVKLTLARLLMACDAVKSAGSPKLANAAEVLQLYTELMKLDPPHNQHYKDEYSLVFLKQVTFYF
ncbi:geranylgeranyl transferase type-2 subunit alpha 1 [Tanacetum coccineum]